MDIFEKCYAPSLAGELKEKGVYPYFHALQSRQDVEVTMEGKRRIMLGSNNYLGLTIQPEVVEAGVKALEQYGTGCSGSRFLNGTLELHLELEAELAKFLRKDGVVTFGTGFQSNVGIISALVDRHDYVICDKENHASIYAGCQMSYGKMLRYRHNDMAELERILQKIDGKNGVLIVTDGVFSMGGDIAKLPEICALARKYGARVMVDDAHGLGVLGEGGRGTASYFGLEDQVDVYMGTFSKSLASLGGYMAASAEVAEFVRHASRPFIFSASIPPANCATALAALRYLEAHPPAAGASAGSEPVRPQGLHRPGPQDPGERPGSPHPHHPPVHLRDLLDAGGRGGDLRPGRVCEPHAAPRHAGGRDPAAHQLHGHPYRGAAGRGHGYHCGRDGEAPWIKKSLSSPEAPPGSAAPRRWPCGRAAGPSMS